MIVRGQAARRTVAGVVGGLFLAGIVALAVAAAVGPALAQEEEFDPYPLRPPNTESPRDTLQSFESGAREVLQRLKTRRAPAAVDRAAATVLRCLDLSQLPPADRTDQGAELALLLFEILSRIELPPRDAIPDRAEVEASGLTSWTIPDTEITIARTAEGPDAGRFQFSAQTVAELRSYYERVQHLPYKPGAPVGVYEDYVYSSGPWLPAALTANLPGFAYLILFGQALWQWLGALATLALAAAVTLLAYRLGRRADRAGEAASRRHVGRLLAMVVGVALISLVSRFLDDGINLVGTRLFAIDFALRIVQAVLLGWGILLALNGIAEAIIRFRAARPGSVDAHLIRIVVRLLGIILLIYLALYFAEAFGIPAAPLLASLGVGGLAIALAVRPTLENINGGFILFADKPVRVGEFCLFGDKMGTVEEVGLRSTRLRALDRTVITVPNAEFAQMQITNFTRRDRMLLRATLGLRYETTPDQLRYVLTGLREMFVAHPKVSPEPARARFIGFGASSFDIEIFVYVLSDDYNEFLGIAEDVNLRIIDIVADAGTGFAFPSQTAYLARDPGLDAERTQAAEAAVQAWRTDGALPFPGLDPGRMMTLDGTLDFPPQGSTYYRQPAAADAHHDRPARHRRWRRKQPPPRERS